MNSNGQEVKGNYPTEEIYSFRESGYIKEVAANLSGRLPDDVELYLYFQLSKWKGNDLTISSNNKKKVVLCVGDESPNVQYPFLSEVDSIFRTYLPALLHEHGKLNHLAVGPSTQFVATDIKNFEARRYNVFFSGNLHLGRADLYRALTGTHLLPFALLHRIKSLVGTNFDTTFPDSVIRFSTGFHNGISPAEYAVYMQDSKICLCPAGVESPETMRHFEAAQLGNIIVTLPLPDVPVYKGAPFVVLSSWRELHKTIKRLLAEPSYMLELHQRTLDWWQCQAAPEAVAAYIQQKLYKQGLLR